MWKIKTPGLFVVYLLVAFSSIIITLFNLLALKNSESQYDYSFIFIVDKETLADKSNPIICLDLFVKPGRTIRLIPRAMWTVENNLSIANCDFDDFVDNLLTVNGVYQGYDF